MQAIIIILAASTVLGLCWHGANGGPMYVSRSERQHWRRVAEEARSGQSSPVPTRPVAPVRIVEQPASEPWLTADELFQGAQAAAQHDAAGLLAELDSMTARLRRERAES